MDTQTFLAICQIVGVTIIPIIRFFSNFSTKPHILYEGAIFLRKFNIKN